MIEEFINNIVGTGNIDWTSATIKAGIAAHPEYFYGSIGLWILVTAILNNDFIFEPPYTTKNVIGRRFWRNAYRWFMGIIWLILVVLSVYLLKSK